MPRATSRLLEQSSVPVPCWCPRRAGASTARPRAARLGNAEQLMENEKLPNGRRLLPRRLMDPSSRNLGTVTCRTRGPNASIPGRQC